MIEIRKTKEKTERQPPIYGLFIDGDLVDSVQITAVDDEPHSLTTTTDRATEQLLAYSFLELQALGVIFRVHYSVEWNEAIGQIWFSKDDDDDESYSLHLLFSKIDHWHRAYSFNEYFFTLQDHVTKAGVTTIFVGYPLPPEFAALLPFNNIFFMVYFPGLSKVRTIASEFDPLLDTLASFHQSAEEELESRFSPNRVEKFFSFPEEIRVPCEQYLLYFTQFLKDLGVEATADLHHEAGKVLFSVLPGNQETALDNIRAALDTYLQLPSSPVNEDSILGIEEQRLAANVEHLRSQLRLANATIKAQQVTINLLENEITPKRSSTDEQKVNLFGGIVALGKLDKYGVEVNYSEIFKRLKRLLGTDS